MRVSMLIAAMTIVLSVMLDTLQQSAVGNWLLLAGAAVLLVTLLASLRVDTTVNAPPPAPTADTNPARNRRGFVPATPPDEQPPPAGEIRGFTF